MAYVKPILAALFVVLSSYAVGVWLNDDWCPWNWDSMARFSFVSTAPVFAAIAGL